MVNNAELEDEGYGELLGNDDTPDNTTNDTSVVEVDDSLDNSLDNTNSDTNQDNTNNEPIENSDIMLSFLEEYGLKDGKVSYENEDGSVEEVNFNELNSEEKLSILKELTRPNLTKDEIDTVNYLRNNNATLQDVIEYYQQKAINEYIEKNGPVEKSYSVDEMSDDELYIADLKSKYDMSDDDIKIDLETAKENEDLFKKKVDIIRKQYKAQEDQEIEKRANEQQEQYNSFKTSLENQLDAFNEIAMDYKDKESDSLQIEESEKESIYRYILDKDENGTTQFFRDLNDPKMLVELAWYALYGKDAMSNISNYWKSQLKNQRKSDDSTPKTIVVRQDKNQNKDNFMKNHQLFVETDYGDDLI